eukprot:scaffold74923_cov24-Cyclotella_meneghiniana.AAC.2
MWHYRSFEPLHCDNGDSTTISTIDKFNRLLPLAGIPLQLTRRHKHKALEYHCDCINLHRDKPTGLQ